MKILILGATSDVAKALASIMLNDGHTLILAGRSLESLEEIKSNLSSAHNTNITISQFDAEKIESHQEFYQKLGESPDCVVISFGYLGDQVLQEKDHSLQTKSLFVNFVGAASILSVIANDFEKRGSGKIVGLGSVAGDRGRASNYIYGSGKAGFEAYLSGLRNRLHKNNVQVLLVKPGFIATKMTRNLKLPPLLTSSSSEVANAIYNAIKNNRNIIYVKWYWRYIMLAINVIPESIFKRLSI